MHDTDSSDATLKPGDVVAGKYRIEKVLGRGGVGIVVSATHLKLGERVAIKLLHPWAAANAEAASRFEREARASVRIKSEHVARVLDVGSLESGAAYIVMEHLDGADLGRVLKERSDLPVQEVVGHILQACEALAEAHALGIVHRDLKPGNLFLSRRADGSPCIKLLDFGISKLAPAPGDMNEATLTNTEALLGTPMYMAPEQMTNPKSTDARADIWSLGATMYKLLTRVAPFRAETMPALCAIIVGGPPPRSVAELRADVPPALDAIILRCLSRPAEERYANVGALARALAEFGPPNAELSASRAQRVLAGAGIAVGDSVPPPADEPSAPISQPKTAGTWSRGSTNGEVPIPVPRATARAPLFALAALALLGAGVLLGAFARRSGSVEPTTTRQTEPASAATTPPQVTASIAADAPPRPTMQPEPSPDAPKATASATVLAVSAAPRGPVVPKRSEAKAAPTTQESAAPPPVAPSGDLFEHR